METKSDTDKNNEKFIQSNHQDDTGHKRSVKSIMKLLRDYQNKIVDTVLPLIKSEGGGLISIPPGRGKTVLAIYLASKLKVKVLKFKISLIVKPVDIIPVSIVWAL